MNSTFEPAGVAVVSAEPDGAAAQAGLEAGDVITAVGSTTITTLTSLAEALAPHKPGDRVRERYLRDGEKRTADVTLGET